MGTRYTAKWTKSDARSGAEYEIKELVVSNGNISPLGNHPSFEKKQGCEWGRETSSCVGENTGM